MAARLTVAPTRPIVQIMSCRFNAYTNFLDLKWDPRSLCRTQQPLHRGGPAHRAGQWSPTIRCHLVMQQTVAPVSQGLAKTKQATMTSRCRGPAEPDLIEGQIMGAGVK